MSKFYVKWKNGKELTVEKSDCETVDQFINSYFGRNADVESFGAEVTLVVDKPVVPNTVVPKTVVKTAPKK